MAGLYQGKPLKETAMLFVGIIAVLLIVWLAIAVLGAVLKGLFWLAVIGGLLFIATAAYGAIKNKSRT
jgi:vacuolar-type H+-ATPase subunit I/STV1